MLRSMYSGISGMRGFQTKLDVIGNNIANVNTSGFKKGRVTFQDMMSQTTRGAQAATDGRGGINPMQVGLGSKVGSIDNIHTQGFTQTTGSGLDLAIEGNGMFLVTDGTMEYYTRAGNFYLDEDGDIVNADGYNLRGYASEEAREFEYEGSIIKIDLDGNIREGEAEGINIVYDSALDQVTVDGNIVESKVSDVISDNLITNLNLPLELESFSISTDGKVNYVDENGIPRVAGQILLANFSNPAGLEKVGNNLYLDSANAGFGGLGVPEEDGMGKTVASALEMSNVDLAEEFTEMIVSQRGFQANTRIITTSDEILQELVNLKR